MHRQAGSQPANQAGRQPASLPGMQATRQPGGKQGGRALFVVFCLLFLFIKCMGIKKIVSIQQLFKTSLDFQQSDVTTTAAKRKDIYSCFMFYNVCIAMIFMQ